MPTPGYIIAGTSGAVDEQTQRVSVFNIIETVGAYRMEGLAAQHEGGTDEPAPITSQRLTQGESARIFIVAAWLQEDGDRPDDLFDIEIECATAGGKNLFTTQPQQFSFTKSCFRLMVPETALPGLPAVGLFTVTCRIRRAGEQEWAKSMSCSFLALDKSGSREAPPASQPAPQQPAGTVGPAFSAD